MQGWFSRYGLTWASAVVLVAAGVSNAFSAVIHVKERGEPPVRAEVAPPAAVVPEAPRAPARVVPVQRVQGALSVDLAAADHGLAVEVRVTGCADEAISLVRRGHSFPVTVYDLDPDSTCTVQARRKDGRFWTRWTHAVEARGTDRVTLSLPDARAAGVGLVVSERPQGALVHSVEAWAPAWQAGLEAGDIVASVDGWSLVGLPLDEMVQRITGAEGTRVELGIIDVRSGRTVYRTVERRYLD